MTRPRSLAEAWERMRGRRVDLRIASASAQFLGAPYAHNPVGDGRASGVDPRPVLRLDTFDCQTFIETVMALAYARAPSEVGTVLRGFRYGGPCRFEHRNQFLTSQWIPHVLASGLLVDDSARVGGDAAPEVVITRTALRARLVEHARQALPADRHRAACAAIERTAPRVVVRRFGWLPLRAFVRGDEPFAGGLRSRGLHLNARLLARLRPGSVLVTRSPLWTHLAIAVRTRGRWWLRQANASRGSVQQYDLIALLQTMARFELCEGIAVLAPRSR